MSITKKLSNFLEKKHFNYAHIEHSKAITATALAAKLRCPPGCLAKNVLVKIDGKLFMALLPASEKIDLHALKDETKAHHVHLVSEKELKESFPDCDLGAVSAFGNYYDHKVIISDHLLHSEKIYFHGGTYTDAIMCRTDEFLKLVHPVIASFSAKHVEYDDMRWHA
jgi:Ala-tRNA(Pro) deacylase